MKFEKLGENKIRITLSMHDLEEKNINFHDFMSNSLESQDLFIDMLEEAEEKIGFKTRDCRVKIEALAMTEDDFVFTVTKVLPDTNRKRLYASPRKKPKYKRKSSTIHRTNLIYKFSTFDDYCNFIEFLVHNNLTDATKVSEKIYVYLYNNSYYLVLCNLNTEYKNITKFYTGITEFASYVMEPDIFVSKLNEAGKLFIKNNAFRKSLNYFSKKQISN